MCVDVDVDVEEEDLNSEGVRRHSVPRLQFNDHVDEDSDHDAIDAVDTTVEE